MIFRKCAAAALLIAALGLVVLGMFDDSSAAAFAAAGIALGVAGVTIDIDGPS